MANQDIAQEELEAESATLLPDREALSIGGFGDEVVDLNFDHPMLSSEIDGYEPAREQPASGVAPASGSQPASGTEPAGGLGSGLGL